MVKFIFIATSDFAVPILDKLIANNYIPGLIIARPDKPAGRHQVANSSPIKIFSEKHNLNIYQPESLKDSLAFKTIKNFDPELIVVCAYGALIPNSILEIPKGVLNIHPSLLPKLRGPSPIQSAILNGDTITGVTIMLVDDLMDHGAIVAQKSMNIKPSTTIENLEKDLSNMSADLLIETLPLFLTGQIQPQEQDHTAATFTKLLKSSDSSLDLKKSVISLDRQIRAYEKWPGSVLLLNTGHGSQIFKRRLKIIKASAISTSQVSSNQITQLSPVFSLLDNTGLVVNCSDGYLILHTVQLEGRNIMTASEFLRGYKQLICQAAIEG